MVFYTKKREKKFYKCGKAVQHTAHMHAWTKIQIPRACKMCQ